MLIIQDGGQSWYQMACFIIQEKNLKKMQSKWGMYFSYIDYEHLFMWVLEYAESNSE